MTTAPPKHWPTGCAILSAAKLRCVIWKASSALGAVTAISIFISLFISFNKLNKPKKTINEWFQQDFVLININFSCTLSSCIIWLYCSLNSGSLQMYFCPKHKGRYIAGLGRLHRSFYQKRTATSIWRRTGTTYNNDIVCFDINDNDNTLFKRRKMKNCKCISRKGIF